MPLREEITKQDKTKQNMAEHKRNSNESIWVLKEETTRERVARMTIQLRNNIESTL